MGIDCNAYIERPTAHRRWARGTEWRPVPIRHDLRTVTDAWGAVQALHHWYRVEIPRYPSLFKLMGFTFETDECPTLAAVSLRGALPMDLSAEIRLLDDYHGDRDYNWLRFDQMERAVALAVQYVGRAIHIPDLAAMQPGDRLVFWFDG